MPTNLRTIVTASVEATYKNVLSLGTATDPLNKRQRVELANGTLANQADRMYQAQRTLAASGSESLDLAGSLVDEYGQTITLVELKAVLISAASTNTNAVRVTRPASNGVPLFLAASDGLDIAPGGAFLWVAPTDGFCTVTAGTGDLLSVANSGAGTSVTYDIVVIGASA